MRFFARSPDSHNSKSRLCDLHFHGPVQKQYETIRGRSSKILKSIEQRRNMATVRTDGWKSPRISFCLFMIFHCDMWSGASVTSLTSLLPRSHSWKHGRIRASDRRSIESCYSFAKQTAPRSPPVPGCSTLAVACQWVNKCISLSAFRRFRYIIS